MLVFYELRTPLKGSTDDTYVHMFQDTLKHRYNVPMYWYQSRSIERVYTILFYFPGIVVVTDSRHGDELLEGDTHANTQTELGSEQFG